MKTLKLTENLWLHEYISEGLYNKYENRLHVLLGLLDPRLIIADQKLRDQFGQVTINSWYYNGARQYSGYRPANSNVGAELSQHKFGRASDKIFHHYNPEEVRIYIRENWESLGITAIENDVEWVHSDVRFIKDQIYLVEFRP